MITKQEFIDMYQTLVTYLSTTEDGDRHINTIGEQWAYMKKYNFTELVVFPPLTNESGCCIVLFKNFKESYIEYCKYDGFPTLTDTVLDTDYQFKSIIVPKGLESYFSGEEYLVVDIKELLSEVKLPETEKITLGKILDLPRTENKSICVGNLILEGKLLDYSPYQIKQEAWDNELPDMNIETILRKVPDNGKYGHVLSVITYKNIPVALITKNGKWTDNHDITPIHETFTDFVKAAEEHYVDEYETVETISMDTVWELPSELEDSYYEKENK